jgi:transcriptional regulator with XRE-family HTH domain
MLDPAKIEDMEEALKARQVPVAELCRRAGINATTWGRWKKGDFSPSYRAGKAVADAFERLIKEAGARAA